MKYEKKIVLCDADGVIENFIDCWIAIINKKYGTTVNSSEITNWEICSFFPTLTKKQIFSAIKEKEIWRNLKCIPGCFDVLKEINDKHILRIVTATHYSVCDKKIERILELYPFLNWEQFIITSHKQLIHGDYLIDDGIHNLIGGDYQGILFSCPHNLMFDELENNIIRVFSWEEIGAIILRKENKI